MNKKKKVIVCGTRFGQFYLEALKKTEEVEIAGILARGSTRSLECSNYYGVKLYKDVDDIPQDIDLACVVLKSEVLGGAGTGIAKKLLEKKISVLMEQPLHYKELAECVKTAKKYNVNFSMGNLYMHLPAVKSFLQNAEIIGKQQEILFINADFSTQVSYPFIQILGEVLPSLRPWELIGTIKDTNPFQTLAVKIDGVQVTLRAHNEVDNDDPDGYLHLLHQITIGFPGGRLMLVDTHGPVIWLPRMHFPQIHIIPGELNGKTAPHMQEDNLMFLEEGTNFTQQGVFKEMWSEAIKEDILMILQSMSKKAMNGNEINEKAMNGKVMNEKEMNGKEVKDNEINSVYPGVQKNLMYCEQWQALMSGLGYPVIVRKSKYQHFSNRLLKKYESVKDTKQELRMGMAALDKACLNTMLYILQKDVPEVGYQCGYTSDELINHIRITEKYRSILLRWILVLHRKGYLIKNCSKYYFQYGRITSGILSEVWKEAEDKWCDSLGPKGIFDYFFQNYINISAILSGDLNAAFLLFPEGKFEKADQLYAETAIARFLNEEIGNIVLSLAQKGEVKILEIGAGTGATTKNVIGKLDKTEVKKEYIFSDVSDFFMNRAKTYFNRYDWVRYRKIDIDKDIREYQLSEGSLDIIIGVGVINNAENIEKTLVNLKTVLKPEGVLILVEAIGESVQMLISQAFMMKAAIDVRMEKNETFLQLDEWFEIFKKTGFHLADCKPEEDNPLSVYNQKLFVLTSILNRDNQTNREG